MFIVNQHRNEIINTDNMIRIFVKDEIRIVAEPIIGNEIMLGLYDRHKNKAQEVFSEILDMIFVPNLVAVNKIIPDGFEKRFKKASAGIWGISVGPGEYVRPFRREVYYMPEDVFFEPLEEQDEKIKESIQIVRTELLKHGDLYNGFMSSVLSSLEPKERMYEDGVLFSVYEGTENDLAEMILRCIIGEERIDTTN